MAFPAAFYRHPHNWQVGRNGTQGLQREGAVLGLFQDRDRNDPGKARCEKHSACKNTSQAYFLGPELNNDKEALYSHTTAIGHFYRLNRAVKPGRSALSLDGDNEVEGGQ